MSLKPELTPTQALQLRHSIIEEAKRLGFQQVGVTDTDLSSHVQHYADWLKNDYHGDLEYMQSHGSKRWTPGQLIDGTLRVISLRMDYLSDEPQHAADILNQPEQAYISRYTLGRDYHKLLRNRLKHLISFIREHTETHYNFRAFVDSAPVLERALAQKAGLGWFGKNTMLINRSAGSWFFIAEIYTDLDLPLDEPYTEEHCGSCTSCLDKCPTDAFVAPYVLDAKRCISYLTIESKEAIPLELRAKMGNRIFGCDDCQIVCPWTKFSQASDEQDFQPRHKLDTQKLVSLFLWSEEEFLTKTEGSAIRRTGYEGWLRNIAVALGNAPTSESVIHALKTQENSPSELVFEHVQWALEQHVQIIKLN
jgi:epoxyqueuosine reductase